MDPVSLLALAPSVMQFAQGAKQKKLLKNLKKDNYIPGAVKEKEARARTRSNSTTLPGQARAEEKMDSATANAVSATRRNAKDSTTVLEKVQEADAVKKSQIGDMNAKLASFKLQNEQILGQALSEKAGYQMKNQNAYNSAKSALEGSAARNFFNSATNAATAGMMIAGGGDKTNGGGTAGADTEETAASATSESQPAPHGDQTWNPVTGMWESLKDLLSKKTNNGD